MDDYFRHLLDSGFDEEIWNPSAPLPHSGPDYEKLLLGRLIKDIDNVNEFSIGNDCSHLVRRWENAARQENYSPNWADHFKQQRLVSVDIQNKELYGIIMRMFWEKENQILGFVAEAIFLKYISQLEKQTSGCFHRLPSFALYDLYEARTMTFIDIKHSLQDQYELRFYHLKNRAEKLIYFRSFVENRNYKFAYLPMKIKQVSDNKVICEIRPLITLENAIREFSKINLKAAI